MEHGASGSGRSGASTAPSAWPSREDCGAGRKLLAEGNQPGVLLIDLAIIPCDHGINVEHPQDDRPPLLVVTGDFSPQFRHFVGAVADFKGQFTYFLLD